VFLCEIHDIIHYVTSSYSVKYSATKEKKIFFLYGKCYASSSSLSLPMKSYRVKLCIQLTIFWTQKIMIKLVMSYERKKNHI